jgi:uncharacterized protein (DUF305 family)
VTDLAETTTRDDTDRPVHRSQRPALLVLAVVAVLAVGLALGALVRLPGTSNALSIPSSSSVDVGFAQDMIVHHNQAVTMANQALVSSTDPVVRNLAFDIASTQQTQIGQMQGWLSLWGQPLLRTGGYMGWMSGAGGHSMNGMPTAVSSDGTVAVMPGMASTADLAALKQATGPAFDVLFLQLMLRHHQGGAGMLSYASDQALDPVVRTFASQVASSQSAEVTSMTELLAQRGAAPLTR